MKHNGCSKYTWQDCQSLRWRRSCYLHAVACQLSSFDDMIHMWFVSWKVGSSHFLLWFVSWFAVKNAKGIFPKHWKGIQVPVFFGKGTMLEKMGQATSFCILCIETLLCGWINASKSKFRRVCHCDSQKALLPTNPRLPNTLLGGTPKTYLKHLLRRYLEA